MNKPVRDPIDKAGTSQIQDAPHPPERILVVDDDEDIRQLSAEMLISHGYEVDAVEDGEAAWNALLASDYGPDSYDLVITDNHMPKLTGLELAKRLRAQRMGLPVILASGTLPLEQPKNGREYRKALKNRPNGAVQFGAS